MTFAGRDTRTTGLMGTFGRAALLGIVSAAAFTQAAAAAPAWLTPKTLSAPGQSGTGGHVAVDSAGDGFAVWKRDDGSEVLVQVSVRKAGGSWTAPKTLTGPGFEADDVEVAASPGGIAIAIWSRETATGVVIQASVRKPGGPWGAVKDLSSNVQTSFQPHVALDRQGNATAVWARSGLPIQAAVRPRGGVWGAPQDISPLGGGAALPQVAYDRNGKAIAVWYRATLGPLQEVVQASVRPRGGAWSMPEDLSAAGVLAVAPHIAFDKAGTAIAVWSDQTVSQSKVQAAVRPAATGVWRDPKTISSAALNAGAPALAVSPRGLAVVVWSVSNGSLRYVQSALRPAGGSWRSPKTLTPTGGNAYAPEVGIDASGSAVAVWHRIGTTNVVQASRRASGKAWTAPKPISTPSTGVIPFPHVAVDPAGNAIAIWQRTKAPSDIVQAAGLDAAGPVFRRVRIPRRVSVGSRHTFSVRSSDVWSRLGRAPLWRFGDGTEVRGRSVAHAFFRTGRFAVTVRQRDKRGNLTVLRRVVVVHS